MGDASSDTSDRAGGLRHLATVFAVALAVTAFSSGAGALDDPARRYATLRTPHFFIHYAESREPLARRTARAAEEAYQLLVPQFDERPKTRTHVVIDDTVDTANGSATVFGRNIIRIYGMPPEPDGVLGYYGDWLRILMYHEYAHILHLETDRGVVEDLNQIFPNVHTNGLLPRWYIEGIATYYESWTTGTGRVNSSLFRMWLRTATLEGEFFSLGTVTGSPITWPSGTSPYLYGGFFYDYLVRNYGQEIGAAFNAEYGGRIVPFGVNSAADEAFGETFHRAWKGWHAEMHGQSIAERVAVEARGRTELDYLTDRGGSQRHPHRRPGSQSMTFYSSGLDSHAEFAGSTVGSREIDPHFEVDGAAGSSDWTPDGDYLLYSRLNVRSNVYRYQDLYAWSPDREAHYRMTEGERARDPAVSPDGDRIAYVRNGEGTAELAVCRFDSPQIGDCRTVVGGEPDPDDPGDWHQLSGPTWSPSGDRLVFSWWNVERLQRDLWAYVPSAPPGERLRRLTDDAAQDTGPQFGPDGVLFWASDRTGIFNVYADRIGDEEGPWQVSNVVDGVFQPAVSENGQWIYASSYTSEGYELVRFPRPERFWRDAPSSFERPDSPERPDVREDAWTKMEYEPFDWVSPLFSSVNFGLFTSGAGLGGSMRGEDPIGHHEWQLDGALLRGEISPTPRANLGAQYSFGGWPVEPTVRLSMEESIRERGLVAESRFVPYVERQYTAEAGLDIPIRGVGEHVGFSLDYRAQFHEIQDRPDITPEPADIEPRPPELGWFNHLAFGLNYTNLDRYPYSVSIERGVSGRLNLRSHNELLGSDYDAVFLTYGLNLFHPNPLVDRHVFNLSLNGGLARSDFRGGAAFALGGHRPQDVLRDMLFQNPTNQFVLRGYSPGELVGTQFQLVTGSYRFPIARIEKGFSTVPFFIERLEGNVFADSGGAFNGLLSGGEFRTGVGAELQLGLEWGYYLGGNLRAGYARGLGEGGVHEWYVQYGGGF